MAGSPPPPLSALFGHYRLDRELGRGGMATVYLARDLKHDRPVALKLFRPEAAPNIDARRFRVEIATAARLQHPHICTVYDSGDTDGQLWFTMPFVRGESLRDRIRREQRLPVAEALRITREAAQALAYAHREGVIHRDVKPGNILLTEDGMSLLADFGIARCLRRPSGEHLTEAGHVVGTPNYMAPEQALAEPADPRADQYALAATCYEMLAGSPPHAGPTPHAVIARRFTTEAPGVRTHRPEVPIATEVALRRALSLTPEDRFGSIAEFSRALTEPVSAEPHQRRVSSSTWITLSLALAVGVVVLAFRDRVTAPSGSSSQPVLADSVRRLAVLPFENLGDSADAYFAEGMADEVRGKLARLPGVEVIARGSSSQYQGSGKSPREIAEELGVRYLLTGTVRWHRGPEGSQVRVSPELVEARTGVTRWAQPFDAALTDVFAMQANIAGQVASALGLALADSVRGTLASRPTASLAAYDVFLKGEAASEAMVANDPPSLRRALVFYRQAVALDPSFVPAWAQLARASAQLFAAGTPTAALAKEARQAAEKALALGPGRPESYAALGAYYRGVLGDPGRSLATYEAGLRLAPNNVDLLAAAGVAEQVVGRWESALSRFKRAATLDPRSARAAKRYANALLSMRRYAEADPASDRAMGLAPTDVASFQTKVMVAVARGDPDEARRILRAVPAGIDSTELIVYFATFEDLWWLLDDAQQRRLLTLPPSAFDDSRGTWGLVLAQVLRHRGEIGKARAYADSAVPGMEEHVREAPNDGQARASLGLALAYAGRAGEAVREGERAAKLQPITEDAFIGPYIQQQLARIYLLTGEPDRAIERLEPLLKVPHTLSPGWLRIDPTWDALRQYPRFRRLLVGSSFGSTSPMAFQKRDATSLTSAPDHAFENRWSTAAASADFPWALNAAARPNSDQPFSGNRFRSSR